MSLEAVSARMAVLCLSKARLSVAGVAFVQHMRIVRVCLCYCFGGRSNNKFHFIGSIDPYNCNALVN